MSAAGSRQLEATIERSGLVSGNPEDATTVAQKLGVTEKRLKLIEENVNKKLFELTKDPEVVPGIVHFVPKSEKIFKLS
ncbi:MAG TPA: hypothetical protein VE090_01440 [Methylomirabilota bacterium]|nr:hypothetical protein [Methylomirabilota bacterium]